MRFSWLLPLAASCLCLWWSVPYESNVTAQSARSITSSQPETPRPTSEQHAALAEFMVALPVWTTGNSLKPDEWRALARAAAGFQTLADADMARVLVIYMEKHATDLALDIDDPDPRTRPLLLLSTMFDLDEPVTDDLDALYVDRSKRGVQICGGFAYQTFDNHGHSRLQQCALPISWNSDGPILTAKRATNIKGQVGGPPRKRYEPWAEFHHFIRFYKKRSAFDPYTPDPAPSWRDLIRAQATSKPVR